MNKYSHILVGELIYGHLKDEYGIFLDKESFIRGNVIPDFSYFAIAHPHFIKLSLGYIQGEVESLSNTYLESALVGSDYSFRLGIICHYYADYFCYAHSSNYRQAVVNHLRYEHLLHGYFQNNYALVAKISFALPDAASKSAGEINSQLKSLHAEYSGLLPSYDNDLNYTLKACAETLVSLVYCSYRQIAREPLESYREAAAV